MTKTRDFFSGQIKRLAREQLVVRRLRRGTSGGDGGGRERRGVRGVHYEATRNPLDWVCFFGFFGFFGFFCFDLCYVERTRTSRSRRERPTDVDAYGPVHSRRGARGLGNHERALG